MLLDSYIRTGLKIVFRPDLFAGVYFQSLEILVYFCVLKQGAAAIVNRKPNFEMGPGVVARRYSAQPGTGALWCPRHRIVWVKTKIFG